MGCIPEAVDVYAGAICGVFCLTFTMEFTPEITEFCCLVFMSSAKKLLWVSYHI